jgi:hypothetical protein
VLVIYLLILIFFRVRCFCEVIIIKYAANIFYIYLGIIVINTIINLILLLAIDSPITLISSNILEIGDEKIILKIDSGKVNSDLVQTQQDASSIQNKDKLASVVNVDGNQEDKCIGKNSNPLNNIHKRLLFADKSHIPSHFQKSTIFTQDVPVYGNKLVTFKPSSLLQNRNIPEMCIEIPKSTSMGKLTELNKAIDGADEAVKLYDSQFVKFNKVLSGIKNGTEEFYPNEAKPLMETYVDLVTKLSNQQKDMANEAIKQLHKLDFNFSRDLYNVDNNGGGAAGTGTGTGIGTGTGTAVTGGGSSR